MATSKWAAYFYDGTSVMINKHGITNEAELKKVWYETADARIKQLHDKPLKPASGTADLAYMQAIHKHINQDTFTWAGKLRDVNMMKAGETRPVFTHSEQIEAHAARLTDAYRNAGHFEGMAKAEFVTHFTGFAGEWNRVHPFREGNGRANKVFLSHVADRAGYALQLDRIPKDEWNQAFREEAQGSSDRLRAALDRAIRPARSVAFETMSESESTKRHPELARLHAYVKQTADAARSAGMSPDQVRMATDRLRGRIVATLDTGKIPGQDRGRTAPEGAEAAGRAGSKGQGPER